MFSRRSCLLQVVVLCWVTMVLMACALATVNTMESTWLPRLDPGGAYGYHESKWSPDAKRIVYTRRERISGPLYEKPQSSEIFVIDVDTRGHMQLTNNEFDDLTPTWSPDGKQIAYVREEVVQGMQSGNNIRTNTIRIMNSDGTNDHVIFTCAYECWWPAWSPVGDQIVFNMRLGEYVPGKTPVDGVSVGIYVINSNGSNLRQITDSNRGGTQPQWSPDGRQIVSARPDARSVSVINLIDQDETVFEVDGFIGLTAPIWSSDQSKIYFSAMRPDQGPPQLYSLQLTNGMVAPVFVETSAMPWLEMYEPDWSPDGKRLIFAGIPSGLYIVDATAVNLSR